MNVETSQFSAKKFLAICNNSDCYDLAVEELNKFINDTNDLNKDRKLDILLGLLRELYQELCTDKAIISILFVTIAKVSIVIGDIANNCRDLLSSPTLPDDLPTTLKQLLLLQQMGVTTLSDLIGSLLSPDNVTALTAMTMTEIASTACEALNMSHLVFLVCQEVELFAASSALTGNLMKTMYNYIKVISKLLDVIDLSQLTDEICSVSKVVEHVYMVSKVTLHCEAAITVATWRTLSTILRTSKPHLPADWSIQPMMKDLCEAVRTKLDVCLRIAVELQAASGGNLEEGKKVFGRSVKMCQFLLNFILMLCKEFDSSVKCCIPDLYFLILIILSSVPPSLTGASLDVNGVLLQQIYTIIISKVHQLITKLSTSCSQFINAVTSSDGVGCDQCLAWCMCLLTTTEAFPDMTGELQELCMLSKQDDPSSCLLIDAIFNAIQHCYVELCYPVWLLPMTITNGQQTNRMMSLYDYVTVRLTAMVFTLPVELFHQMELLLLKYLFSDDVFNSLLAADMWVLMSRKMSAELCLHHATILTGLMMALPWKCCLVMFNLSSLINCLLSCLPLELQVQYVDRYSPSDAGNLKLWSTIDLDNITPDLQSQVCPVLNKTCLDVINYNLKENQVNLINMCWAVRGLTKLLTSAPTKYPSSTNVILNLWTFTTQLDLAVTENQMIFLFVCDVLHLISVTVTTLPVQELVQVLDQLNVMLISCSQHHCVLSSSTRILARCGTIVVPNGLKTKFIQSVVSLFHLLLSHAHWIVHHHGAEAFRSFAEVTCYEKDLEQCIPSNLRQVIEDFLNKLPYKTSSDTTLLNKDALYSRLQSRLHSIRELKQLVSAQREEEGCLQEKECSLQGYNRGITLLKQGLLELQKCRQQQSTPLPHEVTSQLTLFKKDLHSFLTVHTTEPT